MEKKKKNKKNGKKWKKMKNKKMCQSTASKKKKKISQHNKKNRSLPPPTYPEPGSTPLPYFLQTALDGPPQLAWLAPVLSSLALPGPEPAL